MDRRRSSRSSLTGIVLYLVGVGSVYLLALILKLISGNA